MEGLAFEFLRLGLWKGLRSGVYGLCLLALLVGFTACIVGFGG